MHYIYLGICVIVQIFLVINKVIIELKFGKMKKTGHCVYLPESFFWFSLICSTLWIQFLCPWSLRNHTATWLTDVFFFFFFFFTISVAAAQANSRIYYDEEHIYYSTFFGRRYEFQYNEIVGVKRGLDKILLTTHHPNIRVETAGIGRKKFLRFVQLKQKELKKLEKASAKTPKKK